MDHNPNLSPWTWPTHIDPAGQKSIDKPADLENIIWQNRSAPPTPYENALGDALEQVFDSGAVELAEAVAKLNELGVKDQNGAEWTSQSFTLEMKRLGA
jgi:hypothetical protein